MSEQEHEIISLKTFGYSTKNKEEERRESLKKAIKIHTYKRIVKALNNSMNIHVNNIFVKQRLSKDKKWVEDVYINKKPIKKGETCDKIIKKKIKTTLQLPQQHITKPKKSSTTTTSILKKKKTTTTTQKPLKNKKK